jgi:hypothetical protein
MVSSAKLYADDSNCLQMYTTMVSMEVYLITLM